MADLLTVYFTSDTHGYLYPTNYCDSQPHPMGLLCMRFPKDGNTLVIDGGDTLQGSPLTYYCHVCGVPSPVPGALNDRGYDYVTLGNHDFNYGPENLAQYLHNLNARCLCANVRDDLGRLPLLTGEVRTLANGLRVGLVGIVTDWVNRWEKKQNLTGLTISDPLHAAREAIRTLPAHDVLIGIYHGGIEKDLQTGRLLSDTDENIACRLCEELPFDLLLTGHQHIPLEDGHWHGTHIVQTPCNAGAFVRVTMDENKCFSSCLCPVPDHAELTEKEKCLQQDLDRWLDTPTGHLSRPIRPEEHLKMALEGSPIADFFNLVQLDASGADVSCSALANSVRGFDSAVTVRDVVASYVYSNTLCVLDVTGNILRQALEQCASYFDVSPDGSISISGHFLSPKEAHYNYDYFSGIEYTFDLTQPVRQRVVRMEKDGQPILPGQHLSLCMCDYRATGAGDFDFYRSCPHIRDIQTDISELILDYLREHAEIRIPEAHPYTVIFPEKKAAADNTDLTDTIRTERLVIRRVCADDWKAIQSIWKDQAASALARFDKPNDTGDEAVRTRIEKWASFRSSTEHMFFAVCLKDTVIGYAAFNRREKGHEIGYCFHSDHHGKGYARESIAAILARMGQQGFRYFTAGTALENTASVRLLKSLGFRKTGEEKVSFCKDPDGKDIVFDGGLFELEL